MLRNLTKQQKYLLDLAHRSIKTYSKNGHVLKIDVNELPSKNLLEKKATFVTINIDGKLRGCIGHLEPIKPLYQDVIENAVSAAFFDPRFYPVERKELDNLKIEISILTKPEKNIFKNTEELTKKLKKSKPGVIIQKGICRATFLPQVWEELTTPQEFLSHLCLKAGLSTVEWRNGKLKIFTYTAQVFHE